MKKRILAIFLATGLMFVAGCSTKDATLENDKTVNSTEDRNVTEEILSPAASNEETEDESRISDRITYAGEAFLWEEISITIPVDWEDKYLIKEEANGFSVFQKASIEKNENMGFLCGVYKSNTYTNSGTGETLAAYTDDGTLYYVMLPTDVNCYTEDETIVEEYTAMMDQVPWIAGSLQIAADNVHYDAHQYEIPISSIMLLTEYQLANFSDNELWIARNEIYARHGKTFQNEYLSSYFNACSWYQGIEGKTEVNERELNEVELANLKTILAVETSYAAAHIYPKQCLAGEEIEAALEGQDTMCKVSYEATVGENWEHTSILTIDGTDYNLDDYVTLFTPVQDVFYITDIAEYEEGLEIAILDDGASADPITHFFTYDGKLHYIGAVEGFPFGDYSSEGLNGFTNQNNIIGSGRVDLIETAYVDVYYRYDTESGEIEQVNTGMCNYKWYNPHELFVDIPLYASNDEDSPMVMLQAQKEVFFIATDRIEWILVRGSDGIEGYIQIEDGEVLNVGLPAEEVFSDLYFFG